MTNLIVWEKNGFLKSFLVGHNFWSELVEKKDAGSSVLF